jgi:hypothetical protein
MMDRLEDAAASVRWMGTPGTGEHPMLAALRAGVTSPLRDGVEDGGLGVLQSPDQADPVNPPEGAVLDGNESPFVTIGDEPEIGVVEPDSPEIDCTNSLDPIELVQRAIGTDDNPWPGGPVPGNDDPDDASGPV